MSNLLTWTKYTGQDPEIKMRNDFNGGYDSGRVPRTKEFILSLSAEF
ncbi:MAG: hypothetical protein LUD15_06970 [Bacteroides sp.]|nr:hypothetical protein [Bacteroides sp.]